MKKTLQEKLGTEVHQAGSKVDENTFRFDFTYRGRLSDELIINIENSVNEKVQKGNRLLLQGQASFHRQHQSR